MDPTILVALVAAIPSTIASLAALSQAKAANTKLTGNGHGDVPTMLGHLVKWTETHDERHVNLDAINRFLIEGSHPLGARTGIGGKTDSSPEAD